MKEKSFIVEGCCIWETQQQKIPKPRRLILSCDEAPNFSMAQEKLLIESSENWTPSRMEFSSSSAAELRLIQYTGIKQQAYNALSED